MYHISLKRCTFSLVSNVAVTLDVFLFRMVGISLKLISSEVENTISPRRNCGPSYYVVLSWENFKFY